MPSAAHAAAPLASLLVATSPFPWANVLGGVGKLLLMLILLCVTIWGLHRWGPLALDTHPRTNPDEIALRQRARVRLAMIVGGAAVAMFVLLRLPLPPP